MVAGVAAGVSTQANAAKEAKATNLSRVVFLINPNVSYWTEANASTKMVFYSTGDVETQGLFLDVDSEISTATIGSTTYSVLTGYADLDNTGNYNNIAFERWSTDKSSYWNWRLWGGWREGFANGVRNTVEITQGSETTINAWESMWWKVTTYSGVLSYDDPSLATKVSSLTMSGSTIVNPTDAPSGTSFVGWYTDPSFSSESKWESTDTVSSDLTLYAKYSADIYTVTKYAVYNGTVDRNYPLGSDEVEHGTSYPVPTPVYKQNYQFGGWYLDETCTSQPYTSPQEITKDTDLYAKYTWGKAWGGTLRFDLRNSGWAAGAAKYAVYFFDETTYTYTAKGWSELISAEVEQRLIEIPYNIAFAPDKVILVRFNTIVDKTTWEALDDYADERWDNEWNQTSDGLFNEMQSVCSVLKTGEVFWLKGDDYAELWGSKYGYDDLPDYKIGWLANYKVNGSKHVEFYETISLTAVTKFQIKIGNNETYANFTTHPSLSGVFSTVDGYIRCNTAASYSLYYDTVTTSVYITSEELAIADEWGELFLGETAGTDNCTFTKNNWSASETAFWEIDNTDARNLIKNETHYGPHEATSTYLAKAIQRYDYVLQVYGVWSETNPHGFSDFLGRVAAGKISLSHPITIISGFDNNNTTPIIVIVIVSLVAVTTIGGYFYLRKRKQD